jgi:hypothetical protein
MPDSESPLLDVKHVPTGARGAFVMEREGTRVAEMTYVRAGATRAIIDHTFVDESLRGEGAGLRLLQSLVEWARAERLAIIALCPFAKATFAKHESLRDVLS